MASSMIQNLSAEEVREIRKIIPEMRRWVANRDAAEKILSLLIEDRDTIKNDLHHLVEKIEGFERIEKILPALEEIVSNKEKAEWLWLTSKRYGGIVLGLIILIANFHDAAIKLYIWVRTWFALR